MAYSAIELIVKPPDRPVLSVSHGAHEAAILTLTDENGCAKDLTPYLCESGDPESEACSALRELPINCGVLLVVRDYYGQRVPTLCKELEIHGSPIDGQVIIDILPCDIRCPGQYLAEVLLIAEQEVRDVNNLYIEVAPSVNWSSNGPLTISEIRLWTRDWHPHVNDLLDEVEYKDTEIVAAIRRGVDLWNSTTPMLRAHQYSPTTFPQEFRSQWIDVTIGFLKQIAADWYDRNHLPYQAGGVTINDRQKGDIYRKDALFKIQEYKNWLKEVKVQLNMDGAWGRLGYRRLP